jgi:head-tail adaptor
MPTGSCSLANPDPNRRSIGSLRWPVTVLTRKQIPSGTATITEFPVDAYQTHADVQPIGAMTFYAGQQTDRPITHRITMRWLDWIDETHAIIRNTTRLDGTIRTETFRIRRVKEVDGRKRLIEIEAELEMRQ